MKRGEAIFTPFFMTIEVQEQGSGTGIGAEPRQRGPDLSKPNAPQYLFWNRNRAQKQVWGVGWAERFQILLTQKRPNTCSCPLFHAIANAPKTCSCPLFHATNCAD